MDALRSPKSDPRVLREHVRFGVDSGHGADVVLMSDECLERILESSSIRFVGLAPVVEASLGAHKTTARC